MHRNEHYKTTVEITYETTNEIWYLQILVIKVTCYRVTSTNREEKGY